MATVAASAPTDSQRTRDRRARWSARSARALSSTRSRRPAADGAAYPPARASSAAPSSPPSSTPIVGGSGMELLPREMCAQLEHAIADARLHGAERRVLARGDLAVRQPFEVGDLDRTTLLLR